VLVECLLRLGSEVEIVGDGPGQEDTKLVYDDLELSLRDDAGWAGIWSRVSKLRALAEAMALAGPDLIPDSAADYLDEGPETFAGAGMTRAVPESAVADLDSAADLITPEAADNGPTAEMGIAPLQQRLDLIAPEVPFGADLGSQFPVPPPDYFDAMLNKSQAPVISKDPLMTFTLFPADETLTGSEAYIGQFRAYLPKIEGLDALDLEFVNSSLAGRAIKRLVIRFFFTDGVANVMLRRRDCSDDCFYDEGSVWQEDDWGPFMLFKIRETLICAHGTPALQAGDQAVLTEALNLLPRIDRAVRTGLEGKLLDLWRDIVRDTAVCGLGVAA
jgi:hypothetical protein